MKLRAWISEQRHRVLFAAACLVLAIAYFVGPPLAYHLLDPVEKRLVVVDKSVPFENYVGHESLFWLFKARKWVGTDGSSLSPDRDYLGFDPRAMRGTDFTRRDLDECDAVIICDTYGVYVGDYEGPPEVAALEHSRKIYGGLTGAEAHALEAYSAKGGLVIAEFNTFASPTSAAARRVAENTFGVRWARWVGRYFDDLQNPEEVPKWVAEVYQKRYLRPFDVEGAGFVFVRDGADIVVLSAGIDIERNPVEIMTTPLTPKRFPGGGAFRWWMDVVRPVNAHVLYEHQLHVTATGRKKLDLAGIPVRFPAVTRRKGRATYYLAGNYVATYVPEGLGDPERRGTLTWKRWTAWVKQETPEGFVFGWYFPLIEAISTHGKDPLTATILD